MSERKHAVRTIALISGRQSGHVVDDSPCWCGDMHFVLEQADEDAFEFMESLVGRTIVNVVTAQGQEGGPTTTLFFDDGSEVEFDDQKRWSS